MRSCHIEGKDETSSCLCRISWCLQSSCEIESVQSPGSALGSLVRGMCWILPHGKGAEVRFLNHFNWFLSSCFSTNRERVFERVPFRIRGTLGSVRKPACVSTSFKQNHCNQGLISSFASCSPWCHAHYCAQGLCWCWLHDVVSMTSCCQFSFSECKCKYILVKKEIPAGNWICRFQTSLFSVEMLQTVLNLVHELERKPFPVGGKGVLDFPGYPECIPGSCPWESLSIHNSPHRDRVRSS